MARFYFSLAVLGCRANQAEIDMIRSSLSAAGGEEKAYPGPADLVVVNTCAVTQSAQAQSRQEIRKVARRSRASLLIVTGCGAQLDPHEFAGLPGVDLVLGNKAKSQLPGILDRIIRATGAESPVSFEREALIEAVSDSEMTLVAADQAAAEERGDDESAMICWDSDPAPERFMTRSDYGQLHRHRPVIKIQDGCPYNCAYCIVSRLRGKPQSRDAQETSSEVKALVASGIREVVLAGINLGLYGTEQSRGPVQPLVGLLRQLEEISGLERIRLSSLEPMTVEDSLLDYIASSSRVAPHFHLSFQSGDDEVLSRMRRPYDTDFLISLTGRISERIDRFGLGVDIVAGYPGESEAAFDRTLALLDRLPVTYIHPFVYSERPETEGASSAERVPNSVRKERSLRLRALDRQLRQRFAARMKGARCSILVDQVEAGSFSGLCGEYIRLRGSGDDKKRGDWISVVAEEDFDGTALACRLDESEKS